MIFCGAGRGADRLPPALARARRPLPGAAGMSLIARLEGELTAAMKERDAARRDALRLILSSSGRRRRSCSGR